MKTNNTYLQSLGRIGRASLLVSLLCLSAGLKAEPATTVPEVSPPPDSAPEVVLPPGACPLNSGGPSLLGTKWRLMSLYATPVPSELDIGMEVGEEQLTGVAGCNQYTANFKRVGHTGFVIQGIEKGTDPCTNKGASGAPSIDVGDWEGSYLRTLQRAGSVEQEGNTLHFFDRNGRLSVVFGKKYGDGV